MLNSRYRLLYGALIVAGGLVTALLFRKPFDTGPSSSVTSRTSSFTELGPASPIASSPLPEPKFAQPLSNNSKDSSSSLNPFQRYSASENQPAFDAGSDVGKKFDPDKKSEIPELARHFPNPENDWGRSGGSQVTKPAPFESESQNSSSQNSLATNLTHSAVTTLKPIESKPSVSAPVAPAIKPSQDFSASTSVPWPQLPNDPLSATIPPIPGSTNQPSSQQDDLVHWSPNRPGLDQPRADSLAPKVTSSQDPFQQANFSNGVPHQNNNPQPENHSAVPPLATHSAQPNFTPAATATPNSTSFPDARSMPFGPAPPLGSNLPGSNMMRHVIQDGDTLQLLAQHYYGDARRAEELFSINRDALKNPELLPLGTTLQIPGSITSQPFVAPTIANYQSGSTANPGYQSPIPQSPSPNAQSNAPPNSTPNPGNYIRPISTVSQPPPIDSFPRQNIAPPTIYSSNNPEQNTNSHLSNGNQPNASTSLAPIGQPNALGNNAAQNPFANSAQPALNQSGWPPQSAENKNLAGWPPNSVRTPSGNSFTNGMKSFGENVWQGSTSAMNWVGNTVLGSSTAAPASTEKTYIVRAGDSWETLANRFYGDKAQAMKLFQANTNRLNGMVALRPGMVIEVPPK